MKSEQLSTADSHLVADRGLHPELRMFQLLSSGPSILPIELIFKICSELSKSDLYQLRLVCTTLNEIAGPLVWKEIKLINRRTRGDACRTRLREIASKSLPATIYTTHLDIGQILEPCGSRGPVKTARFKSLEDCLQQYLEPTICALQNLKSINWKVAPLDYTWVHEVVCRALSNSRSLEHLRLGYNTARAVSIPTLDFPGPTNLRHLHLTCPWLPDVGHTYQEVVVQTLSNLMANSPKLESLSIYAPTRNSSLQSNSLLSYFPLDALSRLRVLDLSGLCDPVHHTIIPHLRSLRRFSFTRLSYASLTQGRARTAQCLESFQNAGILLESLNIDYIDQDILDCIAAMRGLKEFSYFPNQLMINDQHTEMLSRLLLDKVVGQHATSLEHLFIHHCHMCIDEHNVGPIVACPNLVTLGIAVRYQDIADGKLNQMLEIISRLPKLSLLHFLVLWNSTTHDSRRNQATTCLSAIERLDPSPSPTYPGSLFLHHFEHRLQLTLNGDYRYVRVDAR